MEEKENEMIVYRMDNLEKKVTELCEKITDLLEKLPEKYQTKEMCANVVNRYLDKFDDIQKELDSVKNKHDKLLWSTISCAALVIWDLVKPVLSR